MKRRSKEVDKILLTINTSVLIAFFFIFQANLKSDITKWTLFISLSFFTASLLFLIWHLHRHPKREKLFDELRHKTASKYSKRIASFIEVIAVPLAKLKAKDDILGWVVEVNSKEARQALIQKLEREIEGLETGELKAPTTPGEEDAIRYVVESFVDQVSNASKQGYIKAFKTPLDEDHSKLKYYLDRIAFKTRRHFFAAGCVFVIFSLFIEILTK